MFEMCTCGHFGGESPNSVHNDMYQNGHGKCNDCDCEKFTWKFNFPQKSSHFVGG